MRSAGLTLVELLVVISAIALLAALLFPVFHSSREQARTTVCGANVRQLLVGLLGYEAENQSLPPGFDRMPPRNPPPGGYPGNALTDRMGWWWFNFTEVVRHKSWQELEILRCPSNRLEEPGLKRNILCGNYGANRSLCKSTDEVAPYRDAFVGMPLSTSNVRHPGSTLLLADSGYTLICWWHATAEPPVTFGNAIADTAYVPGLEINKSRELWPGQEHDAKSGRHPNKTVNVGFCDGHVGRSAAAQLLVEKTTEDSWNKRPLWEP